MWTAERPGSAELKLQVSELKQQHLETIKTTKQRRSLIRIIKKIENWKPFALYILQSSFGVVLLTRGALEYTNGFTADSLPLLPAVRDEP